MKRYCCFASSGFATLDFQTDDLLDAIAKCETWRKIGYPHVAMSTCDPNHVGKMGVDDVGEDYDWSKRRDALSVRKRDS
jgi:hypothetical protein